MSIEKLIESEEAKSDFETGLKNNYGFAYGSALAFIVGLSGLASVVYGAYTKNPDLIHHGKFLILLGGLGLVMKYLFDK